VPGFIPEPFHDSLDILQLPLKVLVTDDRWVTGYIMQHLLEFSKSPSMIVGSTLHQVVAGGAIHAATLSVVLVLLAAIALSTLYVFQTLQTKHKTTISTTPGSHRYTDGRQPDISDKIITSVFRVKKWKEETSRNRQQAWFNL
jgi:hypothetical protein